MATLGHARRVVRDDPVPGALLPIEGLTFDQILHDLRVLPIHPGDVLEVHSSLSSLGWVAGGADTVVDALMAAVGPQGVLVMPAFPISRTLSVSESDRARGVQAKVRRLPDDWTGPTGMGAIADAFARRPNTVRGVGLHRVAAWGYDAQRHRDGLTYLLSNGGKALLLGVGIYRFTGMHYAEHVGIPPEVSAYYELPSEVQALYPPDMLVFGGEPPEPGWSKVLAAAEQRGMVTRGRVGAAETLLLAAGQVVALYEQALRDDPYGLLGVERPAAGS